MIAALALVLQAAAPAAPQDARGTVTTDTLWSQALGTRKQVIVYLPPSYERERARRFPVAYYLHGMAGSERDWVDRGRLRGVADSLAAAGRPEMIVVMPDGDDSWYTTFNTLLDAATCRRTVPRWVRDTASYCVPWPHYDDYIAHDLVRFVDGKYRTRADRAHRALAGLSMGGYGAMALAFQYPATFAAAASHSGALGPLDWAPEAFATPYARLQGDSAWREARRLLAPALRVTFGADTSGWLARDPVRLLDRIRARNAPLPALFADCGTGDVLLGENRAFRDALAARGVALLYREWPGGHDWPYWRAHVGESLAWIAERIAR